MPSEAWCPRVEAALLAVYGKDHQGVIAAGEVEDPLQWVRAVICDTDDCCLWRRPETAH